MIQQWLLPKPLPQNTIDSLSESLKVDTLIAQLLLQRGLDSRDKIKTFFEPNLDDLHDPFLMKNMAAAVNRLAKAIAGKEKIMLYGDYDVDGTTSVALMHKYLSNFTDQLIHHIPDRYAEGYGVSMTGMERAMSERVDLVITLDCGVRNVKSINFAVSKGLDVIVCDHHEPGEELPKALVLDPKQQDCPYPYKELSGCGVAFKLLCGLLKEGIGTQATLFSYLDFLALSIGADLVAITGENRILASAGMKLLNDHTRQSFQAMLNLAGKTKPLTITDVVFTLAPRINAAGRMNLGADAVELMLSEDPNEINHWAQQIEDFNQERRSLDQQITQEALIKADLLPKQRSTTVVANAGWSKGVVGIVASRLIEQVYKPTVVLAEEDGVYTGSARTVDNFDIYSALNKCSDLFLKFGGHTHAAGLSLEKQHLNTFIDRFEQVVKKSIKEEETVPKLQVHLTATFQEVFGQISQRNPIPRIKTVVDKMEPFGPGNEKPVFLTKGLYATQTRVLKEKHLKLSVICPESNIEVQAIAFFMSDKAELVAAGLQFDLLYALELNHWNGATTIQLNIKDIRVSEA